MGAFATKSIQIIQFIDFGGAAPRVCLASIGFIYFFLCFHLVHLIYLLDCFLSFYRSLA